VIHVYAIADGLAELPDLGGLDEAALERLEIAGLDVVFSEVDHDIDFGEQAVLQHAAVVDALMARSDAILPGRLGPRFADVSEVEAAVNEQAENLRAALRRVGGCVELGLRVLESQKQSQLPAPRSGSDYLRGRLEERSASLQRAFELHEPLSRLARASSTRESQTRGEVLEASYLLGADDVEGFREELARLEGAESDLAFICTGPWPPYTFASTASL
jgi:hypothetical protein